jgi:hypothetical protein
LLDKKCDNLAGSSSFVFGKAYCKTHYLLGLKDAFYKEFESVRRGAVSQKFRNVFGRYVEAIHVDKGLKLPEELSTTKIKNRAQDFQIKEDSITFTIKRHPQPIPLGQKWAFNLKTESFSLISEEPTFYTCDEASEILGKAKSTILGYVRSGKLKAKRALDIPEIDAWFEDKLARGRYSVYTARNRIIRNNAWYIAHDELFRFKENMKTA